MNMPANDIHLSLGGADAAISTQSMKRIAEELIDNALKFSKPGSPVEITTDQTERSFILVVRDHGVGMDPKYLDEIGAYRQFDRKRHEQQGSGLGLAIAKRMTELYGGRFSMESEVGKGTSVTVEIPRIDQR